MYQALHISVSIARPPADVQAFAGDGARLPLWASGLATSTVRRQGEAWVAEAPFGNVTVTFAPANSLGVLDHEVVLDDGQYFYNPMRVVPNGEGSELIFTLYRTAGMSDARLTADKATVESDLATLKRLLEA